jgi:rhodanese-related sulfurtransferase
MPPPTMLTAAQLSRLVGLPDAPALIDVRTNDDHAADPRMLPGAVRRDGRAVASWAGDYAAGQHAIVVCQHGLALSQGVAAWLRQAGIDAESLEGGFEAWAAAGATLLRHDKLPPRDAEDRTVWVTRARPKVDRIACPWLIRRFIDPRAVFMFVSPAEVMAVAEHFGATPFDVDGVFWSHRGELCTFDVMLEEFGLRSGPLDCLALIVRGADTARLDLAPQAAGLLAASLGLSKMHKDDLAQLDAGLALYDAFYRWSRDAAEETHNWPSPPVNDRPVRGRAS